jgi:hypothetical protein
MIFEVYITMFMLMILFFIIGIFGDYNTIQRLMANFLSFLFALITWAGALQLQIPLDTVYQEYGVSWVSFGFIFLNLIFIILWILLYRREGDMSRWLP